LTKHACFTIHLHTDNGIPIRVDADHLFSAVLYLFLGIIYTQACNYPDAYSKSCITKQSNRRLHFARAAHFCHPFPPIGDAVYRQCAGGGPNHDIGDMHKKFVKIARVVLEITCRTDRQTHRQTYSSQYFATAPAGEVKGVCS